MDTIAIILAALSWAGIGLLSFFLWRIARFYEKSSGERAYAWLFTLPMVLLPGGAAYYLFVNTGFVGKPIGDLLLLAGGVTLLMASAMLQQIMMGER